VVGLTLICQSAEVESAARQCEISRIMGEPGNDSEQLARMEQAAQTSSDPQHIKEGRHTKRQPASHADKVWLVMLGALLIALLGAHFFLNWQHGFVSEQALPRIRNYVRGTTLVIAILLVARLLEVFAIGRVGSTVNRYNLKRILRLVVVLAVGFTIVSVLFVNWYAAVVSLGLISLILGFALQTPISSFIGWIYLLVRAPYRVGDRIRIGELRGDVIDVSYLDTTLWEFGGEYLSTDHPSGRVIRIPNVNVLTTPVVNYSWPLFPYIWNEIKFHVAYESDIGYVGQTMLRIVDAEIGADMAEKVQVYREILAKTPVDQLDVKEKPTVMFRVSDNTWLEAIVRYLVHPKEAGRVKTRLIEKLLRELNSQPDKVLFPKSNMR
jgi:small-conductance mechanosensitive channel